jgi:hypothetical protein
MEFTAKVVRILPKESGVSAKTGNPWQRQSILVEYGDTYPKTVKLTNVRDADAFGQLPIGVELNFKVDMESREYNGKFYTDITCWAWDAVAAAAPQPQQQPQYAQQRPQYPQQQYAQPQQQYAQPQQPQQPWSPNDLAF